jgi:hypothetical protein
MADKPAGSSQTPQQPNISMQKTPVSVPQMPVVPQKTASGNNAVSPAQDRSAASDKVVSVQNDPSLNVEEQMKKELSDSQLSLHGETSGSSDAARDGVSIKLR